MLDLAKVSIDDKIDFLATAFTALDENGKIRTFMAIGREALKADWFSNRGIKEKFELGHREFMLDVLFDATGESSNYITKQFSDAQISQFAFDIFIDLKAIGKKDTELFNTIIKQCKAGFEDPGFDENVIYKALVDGDKGIALSHPENEAPVTESLVEEVLSQTEQEPEPVVKQPKKSRKAAQVEADEKNEAAEIKSVDIKNEKVDAGFSFNIPMGLLIQQAVDKTIGSNEQLLKHVDKRISEEAAKLKPNFINVSGRSPVEIKGKLHIAFKETLDCIMSEQQAFLAGEAGTGKTTLAGQVSEALQLAFGHISCTAGMSEAHLLGRMDAHGNYLQSQLVNLYENGGLFLFDEIDAADANTMLIINSALANGIMSVPNRPSAPVAKRHKDFYCICAANTWGYGSNDYAGRNILDAAFLDRFTCSRIEVKYDENLENEISVGFPEIASIVHKMRENKNKNKIRRVVSTRAVVSGVRMLDRGHSKHDFLNRFTTGWTNEEKIKIIEGI